MTNNELRDTFVKFYLDAKTYVNYYKRHKEYTLFEQGRSTEEIEPLNKELEWLDQAYNKVMNHFLDEALKSQKCLKMTECLRKVGEAND